MRMCSDSLQGAIKGVFVAIFVGDDAIIEFRVGNAFIAAFDIARKVFADEAEEKCTKDVLFEVPSVHRSADDIGGLSDAVFEFIVCWVLVKDFILKEWHRVVQGNRAMRYRLRLSLNAKGTGACPPEAVEADLQGAFPVARDGYRRFPQGVKEFSFGGEKFPWKKALLRYRTRVS